MQNRLDGYEYCIKVKWSVLIALFSLLEAAMYALFKQYSKYSESNRAARYDKSFVSVYQIDNLSKVILFSVTNKVVSE